VAQRRFAFDRETERPMRADRLKTYAQAPADYHLSPESKFENGDCCDRGTTRRRHIRATGIEYIGKGGEPLGSPI
jgi:hypothetical protein